MVIKEINNEDEYQEALKQPDLCFDADPKSEEGFIAQLLVELIDQYEEIHYSFNKCMME